MFIKAERKNSLSDYIYIDNSEVEGEFKLSKVMPIDKNAMKYII